MPGIILPAEGTLVTYAKVERKDGSVSYFKVEDGEHVSVSEEEYRAGGGK